MNLKVSILIPCYNAVHWISQAIESALEQTYQNREVIVVDDGSTDGSLEIIKSFGHKILWESGPNRGGNVTRNRLLELATGEWLQYLDADDYLLPSKIAEQINYIEQHPLVDIVYGPSIFQYHTEESIEQKINPIPKPHDPWILLARWYLPQTGSPLWRKQALIDVGGWKNDQPRCQEHELYLRLLMADKIFQYCDASGSVYRQWSASTISKRNLTETYRTRLAITNSLEQYLEAEQKLIVERQDAINQSRFECARIIWLSDQKWAIRIVEQIYSRNYHFTPMGIAVPNSYRRIYNCLGFSAAENLAQVKRALSGSINLNQAKRCLF